MMNVIIDSWIEVSCPEVEAGLSFTPRQRVVIGFFAALVVVAIVVRGEAL